jgi:UDP-N-acetylmuramate dehydrogenase
VDPLTDIQLAPFTTLGVGGTARFFWEASSDAELVAALTWAHRRNVPTKVLGGGSNVVVSDAGFDGLVIRIGLKGLSVVAGDSSQREVEVAAGEEWHTFVLSQVKKGLQGVECLAGIPGLVGATPIQNVGAYGQEVAETIVEVVALDTQALVLRRFSHAQLKFGYRDSVFKSEAPERFIVTRVRFRLNHNCQPKIAYKELQDAVSGWCDSHAQSEPPLTTVSELVMRLRQRKSMLLDPYNENGRSCGSFFVNPRVAKNMLETIRQGLGVSTVPHYPEPDGRVKLSAAWLIEQAGLHKGTRRGPVGLSTQHSLALVCHDGATARDVQRFAEEIRSRVRASFGVNLVPEPVFWGFESA